MASRQRKPKKSNEKPDVESENESAQPSGAPGETVEQDEGEEPEKLTSAQVKALFEVYGKAKTKIDKAEAQLAEAKAEANEACEAIYYKVGKGPFQVDNVPSLRGRRLTIIHKGDSYYFRSESDRDVMVV